MLLNLLIAILSHTYDSIQQQSWDEYCHGKARTFSLLSWREEDVLVKGVPLPAAMNVIRVVTFPIGQVFGPKLEKLLNMSFLVAVINACLACIAAVYCFFFFVFSTLATGFAGFLLVILSDEDNTSSITMSRRRRRSSIMRSLRLFQSSANSLFASERETSFLDAFLNRIGNAFLTSVLFIEWAIISPIFAVLFMSFLMVYKLPAMIIYAFYNATIDQYNIVKTVIVNKQTKKRKSAKHRAAEMELRAKRRDVAMKCGDTCDAKETMKWSDLHRILNECEIDEGLYKWEVDEKGRSFARRGSEVEKKSGGISPPDFLNFEDDNNFSDDEGGSDDEKNEQYSICLQHAFFFDEIEDNFDTAYLEDEDRDFFILYGDFIAFMFDPKRNYDIRRDETDVLPLVNCADLVRLLKKNVDGKEERPDVTLEDSEDEDEATNSPKLTPHASLGLQHSSSSMLRRTSTAMSGRRAVLSGDLQLAEQLDMLASRLRGEGGSKTAGTTGVSWHPVLNVASRRRQPTMSVTSRKSRTGSKTNASQAKSRRRSSLERFLQLTKDDSPMETVIEMKNNPAKKVASADVQI